VIYVSWIWDRSLTLERLDHEAWNLAFPLVATSRTETTLTLSFANESELAALLTSLRDHGVAFAGALAGWPPAEVFEHLKTRGVVSGPFIELTFRGPGQWITRQR
jgi:hypothetical protein